MATPEFPSNSATSKTTTQSKEKIEPVVSGGAVRRKKSLRKQFSETFVAGDAKTALRYSIFEIMLPAARDMVLETFQQGIEKLILGDNRRRGSTRPQSGPTGHISYNRYSTMNSPPPQQRMISPRARAAHNFDEIVLDQRDEAERVIDSLFDLVSKYESATVADLYELVGLSSAHTDHKWGWTDLFGAGVSRVRGGYLLDLPEPIALD